MGRLTYRTIKGEAMGNSSVADIGDILEKLAEYEDLEERLNGVSVKEIVNGFIKTVESQTNEEYKHGRILTNTEADKWNEYKRLEEQGLLLRLPCKVGDTLYSALGEKVLKSEVISVKYHCEAENHGVFIRERIIIDTDDFETEINFSDIGKTVFLTKAEAEQKLKEMESD